MEEPVGPLRLNLPDSELPLRSFIQDQFLQQGEILKEISLQLRTAITSATLSPGAPHHELSSGLGMHPKPVHEQAVQNRGGEELSSISSEAGEKDSSGTPDPAASKPLGIAVLDSPSAQAEKLKRKGEQFGIKFLAEDTAEHTTEEDKEEEWMNVMNEQQKKRLKTLRSASVISSIYGGREKGSNRTQNLALKVVGSTWFAYGIMLLIVVNMVIMGIEVDTLAPLPIDEEPAWFGIVNNVIVSIFFAELILKFIAFGCTGFFFGREKWWNVFDLIIVGASLIEMVTDAISRGLAGDQMNSSHLRIMRFTRVARALRGVRVFRLLRFISALRAIIFSISSTMWSLVWTLVLLVILFYCFGVILAQLVSDYCRYQRYESEELWLEGDCNDDLSRYWATVPESMMTLFLSISGGLSWEESLLPLRRVSSLASACMIVFIVITVFAVMNVVTGVFCNTAIENAKADKDIAIMKQMHKHAAQVESLRAVFNEIDINQSKLVSLKELKNAMAGAKLSSFMESMDISTKDIWTLFMLLDADESGGISLEEFVSGCMQLEGPAKSIHLAKMRYENQMLRQEIIKLGAELTSFKGELTQRLPPPSASPKLSPRLAV